MAKRQTEEEQNLKRKARRRLIGAIALTLVVVVTLPMVLDSEPKQTGQDIDLRIPDAEKAGEFIPGVVVSPDAMVGNGANDMASASAAARISSASAPVAAVAVAEQNAASIAQPATQPAAPGKAQLEAKNPTRAAAESYVIQVGAYTSATTAKGEVSKLKKWGYKAYTETAGDMIRVRVGPYAQREKAEAVKLLLEKHGLKPVVMSAGSHER